MGKDVVDSLPNFEEGKLHLLDGEVLNQIIAAMRAIQPRPGQTLVHGQRNDGIWFDLPDDLVTPLPWTPKMIQGGSAPRFTLEPGTYDGGYPTVGGVSLVERPVIELTGSGWEHLYLKPSYTYSITHDFVVSGSLDSAVIEVASSEVATPLGPNDTGDFYILLVSFLDGVPMAQPERTSLGGEVCNYADESGNAGKATLKIRRGGLS